MNQIKKQVWDQTMVDWEQIFTYQIEDQVWYKIINQIDIQISHQIRLDLIINAIEYQFIHQI